MIFRHELSCVGVEEDSAQDLSAKTAIPRDKSGDELSKMALPWPYPELALGKPVLTPGLVQGLSRPGQERAPNEPNTGRVPIGCCGPECLASGASPWAGQATRAARRKEVKSA